MLNLAKFLAALDSVNARWDQILAAVTPTFTEWALVIQSTGPANKYLWADLLVGIRKWVGERQLAQIKAYDWTVPNDKFEGSFGELVDNINDDQIGLILPKTENLLASALYHPEALLYQLMLDAYGTNCFDGQYFIDSDHPQPAGSGTFSNLTTAALAYDSLWTALQHFGKLRGPDNNQLGIEPVLLVVGPDKQKLAAELLERERNAAGETNTLRNRVKARVNPLFVDGYADHWQVLARPRAGGLATVPAAGGTAPVSLSGPLTPYIYQQRETPRLVCTAATGQTIAAGMVSEDVIQFLKGMVYFGTDFRGAATFTLPQLVYGSTGTNV